MKKTLTLIFGILYSVGAMAQQAPPTLSEILESALAKNHGLEIANQNVESTLIDLKKLKEVYLPTAELTGKYGFSALSANINTDASTIYLSDGAHHLPALDNAITSRANLVNADIHISSLLYSGGKVPALKKALNEKVSAEKVMMEKDKQEIVDNVLKAYDQLALLNEVKTVLDESQRRLDLHKKTADKALEYGLATKYDRQKIDVAQSQLDSKKQTYEGQRNLLIHQLTMYTGIEASRISGIKPSLEELASTGGNHDLSNRAELLALNHIVLANKYKVEAAKTWWKPKVFASGSIGYLNLFDARIMGKTELPMNLGYNTLTTNHLQLAPNIMVGIGFKWDIFDGNKGKREVEKASIDVKIAEIRKTETQELLELNLIKSRTDLSNANHEIETKKTLMKVTSDALAMATQEYKVGLLKSTDLIDAENDYISATLAYKQAIFNQRRAGFTLMKASGSLHIQNIK